MGSHLTAFLSSVAENIDLTGVVAAVFQIVGDTRVNVNAVMLTEKEFFVLESNAKFTGANADTAGIFQGADGFIASGVGRQIEIKTVDGENFGGIGAGIQQLAAHTGHGAGDSGTVFSAGEDIVAAVGMGKRLLFRQEEGSDGDAQHLGEFAQRGDRGLFLSALQLGEETGGAADLLAEFDQGIVMTLAKTSQIRTVDHISHFLMDDKGLRTGKIFLFL